MSKLIRALVWPSLPLTVAALWLATWRAEDASLLIDGGLLLLDGEARTAERLFAELAESPWVGARARAGRWTARALDDRTGTIGGGTVDADLDASWLPLATLARRAFDDGRFAACAQLAELARATGRPTVRALTAAALVELDRIDEARETWASRVALAGFQGRVARYLRQPTQEGVISLFDRRGRPLGYLVDGALAVDEGVAPEVVPRAVAEAADVYRDVGSVLLSLDLEMSRLALDALGHYRGSIVIVEASTGRILAAVSDRRTFAEGGTPAFEQGREPASISKIITTTAAMRAGIDPDAEIARMRCNGSGRYDGQVLYCPYVAGPLRGLDRALAVSCNVAFADLGVRVGRQRLVDELHRWGFDHELGAFQGGRVVEPRGDARQLADLAIGLEATEITPLHAALMAAVTANDGVMPTPTLVTATDGRLGLHPRPVPVPRGRRVLEAGWVPELVRAMELVATNGTAGGVAPRGFPVAMKTGTASHPRHGFHVNYIGVGPLPDPGLAFAVRITDQGTSKRVRDAGFNVTYRLLRGLERFAARPRTAPAAGPGTQTARLDRGAPDASRERAAAR